MDIREVCPSSPARRGVVMTDVRARNDVQVVPDEVTSDVLDVLAVKPDIHDVPDIHDLPAVSIRVGSSPEALTFQALPFDVLSEPCILIALNAHRVARSGPRTLDRYVYLAKSHRCTAYCSSVRFVLSSSWPERPAAGYSVVRDACHRLMKRNDDIAFPPVVDDTRTDPIIERWLHRISNANYTEHVCACCSELVYSNTSSVRELSDEQLDLLTNPELPRHIFPVGYDEKLVRGAVLDYKGIVQCIPRCVLRVCNKCWSKLAVLKLPPLSLANDNYDGWENVPEDVRDLFESATPVELSLIARYRTRCTIFKFSRKPGSSEYGQLDAISQSYTKGNVITFANGSMELMDVLPPTPDQLRDTISILFVGAVLPSPEELDRITPLLVRRHVVVTLLGWLQCNSSEYSSVRINYDNLNALLGDRDSGVPCGLQMQLVTWTGTERATASTVPTETFVPDDVSQIPVTSTGVISKSLDGMSVRQMKVMSVLNWKRRGGTAWAIPHGKDAVQERGNPQLFPRAYPHLFPWGRGGLDDECRRAAVPFDEHVRHLLNRRCRRFAVDHSFQYVAFNITQRKKIREATRFSVGRSFWAPAHDFLAKADVEACQRLAQRAKGQKGAVQATDTAEKSITEFMNKLKIVPCNIPGTPAAKARNRNEIRASMHFHGVSTLFLTLNPADVHHPLFCKLAGISVDIDQRVPDGLPDGFHRSYLVAKNPTAAAKFFHAMVTAFIDIVLGMKYGGDGLFGKTSAYYGAVEAQGRGTLHIHFLIWIAGALPPQALRDKMQSDEEYKRNLFRYLDSIISTCLPSNTGVVPASKVKFVRRRDDDVHPCTMRCPDPEAVDFKSVWQSQLERLTYDSHFHQHNDTCYKYLKPGQARHPSLCRMRMNGSTRPETTLDPASGSILLRRWHPDINQHSPVLSMLARCNNDVKFIGSGVAAKALTYYICDYVTKNALPTDEAFAALGKLLERIRDPTKHDPSYIVGSEAGYDMAQHGMRFLTRACNSLMACREVSAQEVALYFHKDGNPDHYCSDSYVTVRWGNIWRWVKGEEERFLRLDDNVGEQGILGADISGDVPEEDVDFNASGEAPSTQLDDYRFRGDELMYLGVYWFFACTNVASVKREQIRVGSTTKDSARATARIPFNEGHPRRETVVAKVRDQLAIPCIVGPTLPRGDRPDVYTEYCKAMLILFKPWRQLHDLKSRDETWIEAYTSFDFDEDSQMIMRNFAAIHECKDASDAYRDLKRRGIVAHDLISEEVVNKAIECTRMQGDDDLQSWLDEHHPGLQGVLTVPLPEDDDGATGRNPGIDGEIVVTRELVRRELQAKETVSNLLRAFARPTVLDPNTRDEAEQVDENMSTDLARWKASGEKIKKQMNAFLEGEDNAEPDTGGVYEWLVNESEGIREIHAPDVAGPLQDAPLLAKDIIAKYSYNAEQEAAFGIVAEHHVTSDPSQLVMFLVGAGGTGKSHVVQGWQEFFTGLTTPELLMKAGSTGAASFLIDAETIHSLLGLYVRPPHHPRGERLQAMEIRWRYVRYLIIDESSMVGLALLGQIGLRLQVIMGNTLPFGGLNVIFIGDPRQLPPVFDKALWSSSEGDAKPDTPLGQQQAHGRILWAMATNIIMLSQNYRQKEDSTYQAIVERCGSGHSTSVDCDLLRTRLFGTALLTPEFADAPLVTSDKSVRDEWNLHAIQRVAAETGQKVGLYVAIDRAGGKLLPVNQREKVLHMSTSQTKDRLGRLPLILGMKVMVLTNILTKGGVVNGAEGVVKRIVFGVTPSGERYLHCVFVKVHACLVQYPDLEPGVVPIFPMGERFPVALRDQSTMMVTRWQVPLLPAYAFTDYKSQGRTLRYAILDLASSTKRRESTYVMLSRVVSLRNVLILRRFKNQTVTRPLSRESSAALSRFQGLHRATLEGWKRSLLHENLRSSA